MPCEWSKEGDDGGDGKSRIYIRIQSGTQKQVCNKKIKGITRNWESQDSKFKSAPGTDGPKFLKEQWKVKGPGTVQNHRNRGYRARKGDPAVLVSTEKQVKIPSEWSRGYKGWNQEELGLGDTQLGCSVFTADPAESVVYCWLCFWLYGTVMCELLNIWT